MEGIWGLSPVDQSLEQFKTCIFREHPLNLVWGEGEETEECADLLDSRVYLFACQSL
jgi:hypothetical protein